MPPPARNAAPLVAGANPLVSATRPFVTAAPTAQPEHNLLDRFGSEAERWAAVVARNPEADGHFFTAVRTTGIYCRPVCSARRPLRKNVTFFSTALAAEAAGFRACKRCRPRSLGASSAQAACIAEICRELAHAEVLPDLLTLSCKAGLSPWHFHRVFKRYTGLTPRQYAAGGRAQRLQAALAAGERVTAAVLKSGFASPGRFYATSLEQLGMTASTYRSGGAETQIRFGIAECALGALLVAATTKGVCAIFLGDDPEELARHLRNRFPRAQFLEADANFEQTLFKVVNYVANPERGCDLPLDLQGTAFQLRVWEALRAIPFGSTTNYAAIALQIGMPKSSRAVAGACGANPVALLVPCHRVVRTDGSLSGYRWGVERKQQLIDAESTQPNCE